MLDPAVYHEHDHLGNAPHLMTPVDRERVFGARPEWRRTAGGCLCETCGKEFNDHPPVVGALWLTRLCDDTLVKL